MGVETYIAETDEDLTFFGSDIIELIERIDDNWLKGRCGRNIGIFPQSFVQIERDLPPSGMREEPLSSPDIKDDVTTAGNVSIFNNWTCYTYIVRPVFEACSLGTCLLKVQPKMFGVFYG